MVERIAEIYAGPDLPKRAGDDAVWYKTDEIAGIAYPVYKINGVWGALEDLSETRPISGIVIDETTLRITFNRCVLITASQYCFVQINNSSSRTFNGFSKISDTVWEFTTATPFLEGDTLLWYYEGAQDHITDCISGEDIGARTINVTNPIDHTAPEVISAEIGIQGSNIIAIEFSEEIYSPSDNYSLGFQVLYDNVPQTLTGGSSVVGNWLYLVIQQYATEGQAVKFNYVDTTGDIEDSNGYPDPNALATVLNIPAVNNVTAGDDTERPIVSVFEVNGGNESSTSNTISVNTFDASDNVSAAADMQYQITLVPATPPAANDPNWVNYGSRLDDIILPGVGDYTITAYVKDEVGNVSRGLEDAQQAISIVIDLAAFRANTPGSDGFMQDVAVGVGGLTEARAGALWARDFEGIYQEFGATEPAWSGGRVVGAVGSRQVSWQYENGSPLPATPRLVHQPEATNQILNSEDYSQASWVQVAIDTAPGGVSWMGGDAVEMTETAESSTHGIYATSNLDTVSGVSLEFFIYVNSSGSRRYCYIRTNTSGANQNVGFDIEAKVVTYQPAGVVAAIQEEANGVFRLSAVVEAGRASSTASFYLANVPVTSDSNVLYLGVVGEGMYVSGFNVQAGLSGGAPIPTTGSAVTRPACALSFEAANHNNDRAAYYLEWYPYTINIAGGSNDGVVTWNDTAGNGLYGAAVTGRVRVRQSDGALMDAALGDANMNALNKLGVTYSAGDVIAGISQQTGAWSEMAYTAGFGTSTIRLGLGSDFLQEFGPIERYNVADVDEGKAILEEKIP